MRYHVLLEKAQNLKRKCQRTSIGEVESEDESEVKCEEYIEPEVQWISGKGPPTMLCRT